MQVLVGIPTHKRPELLRQCLESIACQQGDLPQIRVLVADNDSNGGAGAKLATELAAKFPFPLASTVVAEPGISAVRNAILAEARCRDADFIAMIDDDETASPEWLTELLRVQAAFDADVVGGPVIREMPESVPMWLRSGIFRIRYSVDGVVPGIDGTGNILVSCNSLAEMGWPQFDRAFNLTGGGDFEWFTRVSNLGATFAWASRAETTEPIPPERMKLGWLLKRSYRSGMTHMRVARLHGSRSEVAIQAAKAAGFLMLSPLYAFGLASERRRLSTLARWSRALGRIGALAGFTYQEYAERHQGSK